MRGDTSGEGVLRYIISDLGATFKTGAFSRSRNKPSDYVKAEFIKKVNGDVIDLLQRQEPEAVRGYHRCRRALVE